MISLEDFAAYIGVDVDEVDQQRFTYLMEDAEALIRSVKNGLDEDTALWPNNAVVVLRRVMARAYEDPVVEPGASNMSVTAGPFTRQVSYSSDASAGGVWLSKQDRLLLGVNVGRSSFAVDLMPQPRPPMNPDWWGNYAW